MRISDWGSDVCSSDLTRHALAVDARHTGNRRHPRASADPATSRAAPKTPAPACACKTIRSGSPDPSSDPQQRIRQGPRDAAANEQAHDRDVRQRAAPERELERCLDGLVPELLLRDERTGPPAQQVDEMQRSEAHTSELQSLMR